jgi:hypothetical protein
VSNPKRPAPIMRVDPNDVCLTVNGETLDLSGLTSARAIFCPDCKLRRPESSEDYNARTLLVDGDPYPCCNPECDGMWGTGCYHCHHPRFAGERFDRTRTGPVFGSAQAIREAVLDVDGVTDVQVETVAAYTVRVVVTGGADEDIAETLRTCLSLTVDVVGAVEVNVFDEHNLVRTVRFDRPSANGFACEQCKGLGRHGMTFTFRSERSTPTSVECSNCDGLGCVELAKWVHRNSYTITRHGDVLTVSRRRTRPVGDGWFNVDVGADHPAIEGSLGVVLFWVLAHEIGTVIVDSEDKVDAHGLRTPYRAEAKGNQIVEDIVACSRPLCRLPDLWEAQIDARLTEVVIDEVVDGRAVRRMGTLVEVARRRAEAARERYEQEQRAAWDAHPEIEAACRGVTVAHERLQAERAVIRDSIADVDPYEPEWCVAWWLALREWTSAGKEPDADVMADILREFGPYSESRVETSLGYHAELVGVRVNERSEGYEFEVRRTPNDEPSGW